MITVIGIFLSIGLFTIGGGLVAIPLIQQQLVESGYISIERFAQMISIAEATPGPIGLNMSTFVGFELYGIFGGIIMSVAFMLPSYVIITFLYQPLMTYKHKPLIKTIFIAIKAAVVGLMAYAAITLSVLALFDASIVSLMTIHVELIVLLGVLTVFHIYVKKPIFTILMGALLGITFHLLGILT